MANTIDDNPFLILYLKQYAVVTNAKPIFRREICEPFDISFQTTRKILQRVCNSRRHRTRYFAEILACPRLQLNVV